MITPEYVRMMAAYNAEMNRRLYGAAANLTDAERKAEHGAFWGSIHGTLNHLLWGDQQWMSRFAGWAKPAVALKQSSALTENFFALRAAREKADADLILWAGSVEEDWLARDEVWFSGSAQKDMKKPRKMLLPHMFNHQTHHRGQVHAMLTAAGQKTGDTDLFLIAEELGL